MQIADPKTFSPAMQSVFCVTPRVRCIYLPGARQPWGVARLFLPHAGR